MNCVVCGKELPPKKRADTCNQNCYYKKWYKEHKDIRDRSRKKYYVPHPKVLKTEEEKKARRKKYYEEHREYYKQLSKKHYLEHKNDEQYKERHRKAMREYYARKRKEN